MVRHPAKSLLGNSILNESVLLVKVSAKIRVIVMQKKHSPSGYIHPRSVLNVRGMKEIHSQRYSVESPPVDFYDVEISCALRDSRII